MRRRGDPTVVVAIITYQRAFELRRCLSSVYASIAYSGRRVKVLVVDNNPDQSAQTIVRDFDAIYGFEPTPGIVASRNRVLQMAKALDVNVLLLLDDDETASLSWVSTMLRVLDHTDFDIVSGPAVPVLEGDASPRMEEAFAVPRPESGPSDGPVASNNVAFRLDRIGELKFDAKFSGSGGEDTAFFDQLRRSGASTAWCNEAEVSDLIPVSRQNWSWLINRWARSGTVSARIRYAGCNAPRVRAFVGGVGRVAIGFGEFLLAGLQLRFDIESIKRTAHGSGYIFWSLGAQLPGYRTE